MSKQQIKKFRKNDYSYDDEEEYSDNRSNYLDKKKQKRVDRALRTKDIDALLENEENGLTPEDYDYIVENEIEDLMNGKA
jgi:hypothetical protein